MVKPGSAVDGPVRAETVRSIVIRLNVAVMLFAASIVTVHAPVPVQVPFQPAKTEPEEAAAVSVTRVPLLYGSEQSAPQLIPAGDELTVPAPVPPLLTLRVYN